MYSKINKDIRLFFIIHATRITQNCTTKMILEQDQNYITGINVPFRFALNWIRNKTYRCLYSRPNSSARMTTSSTSILTSGSFKSPRTTQPWSYHSLLLRICIHSQLKFYQEGHLHYFLQFQQQNKLSAREFRARKGVLNAINPFWAKIKTRVTASCNAFCKNFLIRNQDFVS